MVNEPLKDAEFTVKDAPKTEAAPACAPENPIPQSSEGWGKKQKAMTFLNVMVMILVAFAILVAANYISRRHYFRIDCTFKQEYSVSTKTKDVLKQIPDNITIYTFFVQPMDQVIAEVQRMMTDLLEEYKIYSQGKIIVEPIQPTANPEMVEILQKKFKMETIAANDIIIVSGSNQKNINLVETYERDEGPYGRSSGIKAFKGEEAMTSAIMNILKPQKTVIYFAEGHKEGAIDDNSIEGYSAFVNYLQRENIECKKVTLLGITQIPADCSALVIAGPKAFVSMPERTLIDNYLKNGGRVMIMIDPMVDTGLKDFLAQWGVKTEDGIIIDPEKSMVFFGMKNVTVIIADDYPGHTITAKMAGSASIFPGAMEVSSISPTLATDIVKSSASSWLETDLEAIAKGQANYEENADRKGPISIGVAVSKKEDTQPAGSPGAQPPVGANREKETRMVVFGDSDMVRNKFIDPESMMGFGRVDIAINSIRWLTGQESFINIEPKKAEVRKVELTPERLTFLFWFSLIIIPAFGAMLGILVWIIRRR